MQRKKSFDVVLLLLILIIAAILVFIFGNSLMSNEKTSAYTATVREALVPRMPKVEEKVGLEKLTYLIRKGAHIIEFGALGAALTALCLHIKKRYGKLAFGVSAFSALLVADIDEFLQTLHSGRYSLVKDVFIDFLGILIGSAVMFALWFAVSKFYKKIKKE